MRDETEPRVTAWLNDQSPGSTWLTSVTVFEIRMGLELLPLGRRRRRLEDAFTRSLDEDFEGRVWPFDRAAAEAAAVLAARRRAIGRPVEYRDTQIAGIAIARGAALATRNIRDFSNLPVTAIDPWQVGA